MIQLRTLGALNLQRSDGQLLDVLIAQPKRVALLAYLALAAPRGFHRRDTLLALFWPDHDAEHARNSLSQSVHVLRRSLGAEAIVSRNGDALGVDPTVLWCDAVAFDDALEEGRLAAAVELYRGDLLDGFHLPSAPQFERWLDGERVRLAGRHAQVLEAVAEARERAGEIAGAVAAWRQLAARDPYNSRVALRLMRALAASGDAGGAVQWARVHERLLREELGIAPAGEIVAFLKKLQSRAEVDGTLAADESVSAVAREPHTARDASRQDVAGSPIREAIGDAEAPNAIRPVAAGWRQLWVRRRRVLLGVASAVVLAATARGAVLYGSARSADTAPIRSLAVLPFERLAGDSAQAVIADVMHDALVTELGRYSEPQVKSLNAVRRYQRGDKDLRTIARELEVDGFVEVAISRSANRIRVTAKLAHGPSETYVWADKYESDLRDLFAVTNELATAIARHVRVAAKPLRGRPRSVIAVDSIERELFLRQMYLSGVQAERSRSLDGIKTAKAAYQRALERDSTFALGYAGLAGVYGFLADYRFAPIRPVLDSASLMARRAVELDSTLPEARVALAVTLGDAHRFEDAEREFIRAIQLDQNNARAHYWYSILLNALGRGTEALHEADLAAEREIQKPRGLVAMQRYAVYLITGNRPWHRLPVRERRRILKEEPGEPWARAREAEDLAEIGHCDSARVEIADAQRLAPDNFRMLPSLGLVYWRCGERERARALLRSMKQRPDAYENGIRMAILHAAFGERDSAFVWLRRQHWSMAELSALSADQYLDPLRSDPRFAELLKRLGIRR